MVDRRCAMTNEVRPSVRLSIARWIAEQHDVEITLKSELGKGTEIHLRIPLAGVEPRQDLQAEVTKEEKDGQEFWDEF